MKIPDIDLSLFEPTNLKFSHSYFMDNFCMRLDMLVRDVDTRALKPLTFQRAKFSPEQYTIGHPTEMALRMIRSFIRESILHEIDECTVVNGVRLYDPHISEKERVKAADALITTL
jgi:hypothetical protein